MKKGWLLVVLLIMTTMLGNATELKRNGWNLISVCQDMNRDQVNMDGIEEIQSQDGLSIYTGDFATYSNLNTLQAGYGYWVKGEVGTNFESGQTTKGLIQPLMREGWNLMASCEDVNREDIDMSVINEIQSQGGKTLYSGAWEPYSNLDMLVSGYGYWVDGNQGVSWRAKQGPMVPPTLADTTLSVIEDVVAGTIIGTITITNQGDDAISAITLSGVGSEKFSINSTGNIIVNSNATLDYETTQTYNLTAIATNGAGNSNSIKVTITVTNAIDNVPVLETPTNTIVAEDISVGSTVVTMTTNGANSDENSVDSYAIVGGNTNNVFTISNTGVISIVNPLDYETLTNYTLQVQATNGAGNSEIVNVEITVTDIVDIPVGFNYQTINNDGEAVETTFGNYTIKLLTNYEEANDLQLNHVGVVVNLNGNNAPLLSIQSSYIGHQIAVGVYDNNGELVGVSDVVTLDGKVIIPVVTAIEKEVDGAIKVSNTAELRKALTEVASNGKNDTIVLSAGTYKTTDDGQGTFTYSSSEDYNLTIKSANGLSRDDVVLDGDNSSRVLGINGKNVILKNLTISNGLNNYGAGIYQSNLTTLESCNVIYNHATKTGGGIYVGGKVIVKDSNISYNKAEATSFGSDPDGQGGGIYGGYENQFIEVYDSILSHNFANKQGGAIGSAYGANIRVIDSILSYNKVKRDPASSWGGNGAAISGYQSTLVIVNSKIFKNENIDDTGSYNSNIGGTINSYISSGNEYYDDNRYLMIINSVISDNINGGIRGSFTDQRMILLLNSTITNNTNYGVDGRMLFINNIFDNDTTDIKVISGTSFYNNYFDITKIINPLNITIDENNIDASMNNLTFVNSDYRLSSNAITVDKGLNPIDDTFKNLFTADEYAKVIQMMQTDKDGNARVSGNGIDIGAYEFNGGTENQPNESDTTPPNAPTLTTTPPLSTTANSIDIEVNGEAESHIYVNHEEVTILGLDGRAFITLNLIYEGENHFDITLRDNSGNESEVFGFTVTKELSDDGGNSDSIDDGVSNPSIGGNPDDGMGGF